MAGDVEEEEEGPPEEGGELGQDEIKVDVQHRGAEGEVAHRRHEHPPAAEGRQLLGPRGGCLQPRPMGGGGLPPPPGKLSLDRLPSTGKP